MLKKVFIILGIFFSLVINSQILPNKTYQSGVIKITSFDWNNKSFGKDSMTEGTIDKVYIDKNLNIDVYYRDSKGKYVNSFKYVDQLDGKFAYEDENGLVLQTFQGLEPNGKHIIMISDKFKGMDVGMAILIYHLE